MENQNPGLFKKLFIVAATLLSLTIVGLGLLWGNLVNLKGENSSYLNTYAELESKIKDLKAQNEEINNKNVEIENAYKLEKESTKDKIKDAQEKAAKIEYVNIISQPLDSSNISAIVVPEKVNLLKYLELFLPYTGETKQDFQAKIDILEKTNYNISNLSEKNQEAFNKYKEDILQKLKEARDKASE